MRDSLRMALWIAGAILLGRWITMAWLPMSDTTEPRYAEIARLMLESGDWITPWFAPGTPFWGKPPLSFWLQALSMKLFGVSDFAARLPAWLAMIGTFGLAVDFARKRAGQLAAAWTALILPSTALAFISAGAVMTDPFLAFGTTLALLGFAHAASGGARHWGWMFFVGLSVGLLAKGPVAAVLIGMPIAAWALWGGRWRNPLRVLPWSGGTLLTVVLVVPWYLAAELKTPGFLDYFLIGEHFRRFVDPGWAGDLYGNAHDETRGMIWVFLAWATLPWGPIALAFILRAFANPARRQPLGAWLGDRDNGLLIGALCAAPLFFTLSGNILWTYVLPSLPFFAVLTGLALKDTRPGGWGVATALALPVATTVVGIHLALQPQTLKSEAALVFAFQQQSDAGATELLYLGEVPFSARYYSHNAARPIARRALDELIAHGEAPVFVAVPNRIAGTLADMSAGRRVEFVHTGRSRSLMKFGTEGDRDLHANATDHTATFR